jgi:hypothetical protein
MLFLRQLTGKQEVFYRGVDTDWLMLRIADMIHQLCSLSLRMVSGHRFNGGGMMTNRIRCPLSYFIELIEAARLDQ